MKTTTMTTIKTIIAIILLIPLLACSQTKVKDIQTVKIANNTTAFGKLLPSGTLILDVSTSKTYYLIAAANADKTIISSGAKTADPSGLELITEDVNDGWRLIGSNPSNFGYIGNNAIDLSISSSSSFTHGATGDFSFTTGEATTASGNYAFASGGLTDASGTHSTAMGKETTASGASSFASGEATTASNYYSTAMGYTTVASGSTSFATGNETVASGNNSFTQGEQTTAQNTNQLSIGQYNNGISSNTIFEVGIGTGVSPQNAFEVSTNGLVWADHLAVEGNITLGGTILINTNFKTDSDTNYKLLIEEDSKFLDNLTVEDTLFINTIHRADSNYLDISGNVYNTGGNGDVNNNGQITATDALVAKYMVNTNDDVSDVIGYDNYQALWARGDIDGDGTVSLLEATIIQLMASSFFSEDSLRLMSRKLNSRAFTVQNHTGFSGVTDTWDGMFSKFIAHIGTGVTEETTLSIDNDGNTAIKAEIDTNYTLLVGGNIGIKNTGGSVFIGENAGITDDLTDNRNVFVGRYAGWQNTTASYNVGIGSSALYTNTTGSANTAVGAGAMDFNITGTGNTAFGNAALYQNETGDYNVAIGNQALGQGGGTESYNVAIGADALETNQYGSNVAIGYQAGQQNMYGTGCVFIGYQAGRNTTAYGPTTSNILFIDNSDTAAPLIYGKFDSDSLVINGDLRVAGKVILPFGNVPSSATATGTQGQIIYGEDYIYICFQPNEWKRVAITDW